MNQLRGLFLQISRWMGHANAVAKGPEAMAKRAGRVVAYRAIFRALRKVGL